MAKTFDNRDVSYNKGKAFNLNKKQLKKAGAAKVAKRTVSISSTKRATSGANKGKTLGPAGKPLNGTVVLPSGVRAVYKDGKRVTVSRAKPAAKTTSTPRSTSGASTKTPPKNPPPKNPPKGLTPLQQRLKDNKGVSNGTVRRGRKYNSTTGRWVPVKTPDTKTSTPPQVPQSTVNSQVPKPPKPASASSSSSSSSSSGKKWYQPGGGGLAGPNSPFKGGGGSGIKVGEIRNIGPNSEPHRWDGSKFVPVSGSRTPKPAPAPSGPKKGDTDVRYEKNIAVPYVYDGKNWVKKYK